MHCEKGGIFMRKPCRKPRSTNGRPRSIGCFSMLAGVFILLAMVLPVGFWWFMLAILLIATGIWLNRC